jgi:thioredoxin reductase (NADPH)
MHFDVAIIGAGPVGIFASFQAGLLGMKSCIIDALEVMGGQCAALYPQKPIYDIPAYHEIKSENLISELVLQASRFAPEYFMGEQVVALSKEIDGLFTLKTSKDNVIKCKAVIIAAGSGAFGPNKPPLQDIEYYENKSVFYHIIRKQDFANKNILIAGGGDSAVDWAIELANIANVTIVHRRDKFRAADSSINHLKQLVSEGKVRLITNYQLYQLIGDKKYLTAVEIIDLENNILSVETDILLPFFGLSQDLGPILDFGLNLSSHNHQIEVSLPYYQTNITGIYAIGDVASYTGKLKLIMTGFAEAASALHHAYNIVFDGKALHFEHSTSKIKN